MSTPVRLTGENAILKCSIHNFSTDDPIAYHAHLFTAGHTETGSRPCEVQGCTKIATFVDKPQMDRALCSDHQPKAVVQEKEDILTK